MNLSSDKEVAKKSLIFLNTFLLIVHVIFRSEEHTSELQSPS